MKLDYRRVLARSRAYRAAAEHLRIGFNDTDDEILHDEAIKLAEKLHHESEHWDRLADGLKSRDSK